MTACECPAAGFCNRYQRDMGARPWQICNGIGISPEKAAAYRRNWASLHVADTHHDPGEALTRIIRSELGISHWCEGCKSLAKRMSEWGPEVCRERRAEIVAEVKSRLGDIDLLTLAGAGLRGMARGWLNPLDPVGSTVDEAIRRSTLADQPVTTLADALELIGKPAKRSKPFLSSPACISAAGLLLDDAVKKHYPKPPMEGRGIVISGGGRKYFPLAYVAISNLRMLGCTLPIELWHIGPEEMPADLRAKAADLENVRIVDALATGHGARKLGGWESKPYSMLHSAFAEVLYMDADNIAVRDPAYLFDDPEYRRTGAIFWPDPMTGSDIHNEAWQATGIPRNPKPYVESGQVLVNKEKCWQEINVCMHLNEYSDLWYSWFYGDKDTFPLAWWKIGTEFSMPRMCGGTSTGEALVQHDMAGKPLFHHMIHGKRQLTDGVIIKALPRAARTNALAAGHKLKGGLLIPQPPEPSLNPKHDLAIVTVVVGDEARQMYAITRDYFEAYGERVGADFVVLDWEGHKDWPMSSKHAVARVLDHYQRIAFVDADILLRPGCVNLFDLCEPHEMGVFDELPFYNGANDEHLAFRQAMGFKQIDRLPFYANAGVMIVPQSHQHLLLPPTKPLLTSFYHAEQDWTNAALLDSGLPYKLLDRRANWQLFFPGEPPEDAVLHWAGVKDRLKSMAEWCDRYPLGLFNPPRELFANPLHSWYADLRHVREIHRELMTGKHCRVLEVGCHHGFSTTAILDAARAGHVDEIHLCDLEPTPELQRTIEHYRLGDRVKLHRCRSLDLLASDARWDFAFIDGDHGIPVCTAEAELLIAARVPVVAMHDSRGAEAGYKGCDGPAAALKLYRAAGYSITEDCQKRPGERTERGFAVARISLETQQFRR